MLGGKQFGEQSAPVLIEQAACRAKEINGLGRVIMLDKEMRERQTRRASLRLDCLLNHPGITAVYSPGEINHCGQERRIAPDRAAKLREGFVAPPSSEQKVAQLPVRLCIVGGKAHGLSESRPGALYVTVLVAGLPKLQP